MRPIASVRKNRTHDKSHDKSHDTSHGDSLYSTPKQRTTTDNNNADESGTIHTVAKPVEKPYDLENYDEPIDLSKFAATSKKAVEEPVNFSTFPASSVKRGITQEPLMDIDADYAQRIIDKYINPAHNMRSSDSISTLEAEEEIRALRLLSRQLLKMKGSTELFGDKQEINPSWLAKSVSYEEQASKLGKSLSPVQSRSPQDRDKMEFTALVPDAVSLVC